MSTRTASRVSSSFSAPKRQLSRVPYLPGLDGLRALAVVAVMMYHANHDWLRGGFLGVEVFFVISGYLITLLLIGEHERNGKVQPRGSSGCAGRAACCRRVIVMMAASPSTSRSSTEVPQGRTRGDFVGGLFYVSNWYQIFVGQGYTAGEAFVPAAPPVVAGGGGAVLPALAAGDGRHLAPSVANRSAAMSAVAHRHQRRGSRS